MACQRVRNGLRSPARHRPAHRMREHPEHDAKSRRRHCVQREKRVRSDAGDPLFSGYEIHLGETTLGDRTQPLFQLQRLGDEESHHDGAISADGRVLGTYLHGLFDSRDGLAFLLSHWRKICGKQGSASDIIDPMTERERRYDALAEHYRNNLRMDLIYSALDGQG